MSDNPYRNLNSPENKPDKTFGQHDGSGRTFVNQVGVISGLMIAQAVLLLLFAIFCIGYAIVMANISTIMPPEARAEFEQQMPPGQARMLTYVFAVWGAFSLVMGTLYIVTGIMNMNFKARGLGITTLLLGLGSVLTCYCAPTGIALSIYGLIIYFNPATAEAFRLKATGMSKKEVLRQFVR